MTNRQEAITGFPCIFWLYGNRRGVGADLRVCPGRTHRFAPTCGGIPRKFPLTLFFCTVSNQLKERVHFIPPLIFDALGAKQGRHMIISIFKGSFCHGFE
jgi:hypothetical protein